MYLKFRFYTQGQDHRQSIYLRFSQSILHSNIHPGASSPKAAGDPVLQYPFKPSDFPPYAYVFTMAVLRFGASHSHLGDERAKDVFLSPVGKGSSWSSWLRPWPTLALTVSELFNGRSWKKHNSLASDVTRARCQRWQCWRSILCQPTRWPHLLRLPFSSASTLLPFSISSSSGPPSFLVTIVAVGTGTIFGSVCDWKTSIIDDWLWRHQFGVCLSWCLLKIL